MASGDFFVIHRPSQPVPFIRQGAGPAHGNKLIGGAVRLMNRHRSSVRLPQHRTGAPLLLQRAASKRIMLPYRVGAVLQSRIEVCPRPRPMMRRLYIHRGTANDDARPIFRRRLANIQAEVPPIEPPCRYIGRPGQQSCKRAKRFARPDSVRAPSRYCPHTRDINLPSGGARIPAAASRRRPHKYPPSSSASRRHHGPAG